MVHISSTAVYAIPKKGDIMNENYKIEPVGNYGRAKYGAELVCKEYMRKGLNITILRPRTIIGTGRMGIFSILFDWIRRGKNIYIMGDGNNLFSFVSAGDLAEASILSATKKKTKNQIFNISTDKYGTLREDLEALIEHAGTGSRLVSVNATLVRTILYILDKL